MDRKLIPVACTLTEEGAVTQAAEWADLVRHATTAERVDGGAELDFGLDLTARVKDLADREATCCAFLSITTTRTDDGVRLRITAEDPEAWPLIEGLAGLAER